jgi:hypothetical protein
LSLLLNVFSNTLTFSHIVFFDLLLAAIERGLEERKKEKIC